MKTILLICVLVQFVCLLLLFSIIQSQRKQIKSLKGEADAYMVTAEELQRLYDDAKRQYYNETLLQAEYITSDSDYIRYTSQKAMDVAVKRKIAMLISNDIIKKFIPSVVQLGDGTQKYSLILKVKKI